MNSKEAILISKLSGKKKVPSTDLADDGRDFRGIKNGVKDSGPGVTIDKVGSSLDLLKAQKASDLGKVPSANLTGTSNLSGSINEVGDSAVPKTKKVPYSPIQNYLKKGK